MDNPKLISIGDLFKKSFDFYKDKLYVIITLALMPFANFVVISLAFEIINRIHDVIFVASLGLLISILGLFSIFINLWVQIAFFYAIKEKDIKTDAKSLLLLSWNKIWSYSWVAFLTGIIFVAGFILFIVPGIIFSIWFSLSSYVFVWEDLRGMKALYRSKELVKGYWWAVFGRFFVFGLIAFIISIIPVIGPLVNIFFTMPLGIIYGYFIYEDLKKIKQIN